MNCNDAKKKIMESTKISQVDDVLKQIKGGPTLREHIRLAYQVKEKQPELSDAMLSTAIQEVEEKMKGIKEYEGGDSHGVGGTDRVPKDEHKDSEAGAEDDKKFPNPQDQMSGGPAVQEDIIPGMMPDLQRMMAPQMNNAMNQMPPMSFPNQIKQMQYTAKKMVEPMIKEIQELKTELTRVKEGISKLDEKVRETKTGTVALQVPQSNRSAIKETLPEMPSVDAFITKKPLSDVRFEIEEMDRHLSNKL